ncbi:MULTISPECIES: nucleotide pyrophosphohydrolase [Marinobacter]|jgi:NTP pyrophosphatase (non-canonical NTP hydrolase)|uniref:Nucleotide pyrophosphohydrolase n=1 Tax=Marinobacter vinifirmus TaxID=355591 RepID=A0A558BI09_9GAMM|nr:MULTISPECIES: nucleotide pyrophosphohydrolase [Marinobacter]MCE0759355.1 nucleotide pyrophosphohydrolase [Marinobacter sp. G11]TVT36126.1 MAG: nucleotide pyrophosphohydrolase [Marinobacter vinifirmus]HBM49891.1 nucleotide pyrophosphohydrolase [Marinobacter sp.]|tara:strand:- start:571 stop:891 length:321 start_codon:yes stop_codon:yes gene_type:complete
MNEAIARLRQFRDDRDWKQFHNPKDLSLALSIEASELLELFLWKSPDQADVSKVKEELADVIAYALLLADSYELDVEQIVLDKIALNEKKYPVSKARGTAKKYTEL